MLPRSKDNEVAGDGSLDWEFNEGSQSWASSTSWSDDLESEVTTHLQQQLEIVDDVLYGDAPRTILSPALRQEITLWHSAFPHLRIRGSRPPITLLPVAAEDGEEEVFAAHGSVAEENVNAFSEIEQDSASSQETLKDQIRLEVMKRLVEYVKSKIIPVLQSQLSLSDESVFLSSGKGHREPLLPSRQTRREGLIYKQSYNSPDPSRVSPLPKCVIQEAPVRPAPVSRPQVTLPPIDIPDVPRSANVTSQTVLGRQTRIVNQRTRVFR